MFFSLLICIKFLFCEDATAIPLLIVMGLGDETKECVNFIKTYRAFNDSETKHSLYELSNKTSASFGAKEWNDLANLIVQKYSNHSSFVVLHGQSQMEYTASYLSFFFQNITKPIVFTTYQYLPSSMYSDFVSNVLGSLRLCSEHATSLNEVVLYIDNNIIRANRAIHLSSRTMDSFVSTNYPVLGTVAGDVALNTNVTLPRPSDETSFNTSTKTSKATDCVVMIWFYPGMQALLFNSLLKNAKGAVVMGFGMGNGPSKDEAVLKAMKEANDKGTIIVDVTQCYNGYVDLGEYQTGNAMRDCGIIPLADITPAAAFTKLTYLLSVMDDQTEIKRIMEHEILCGEFTPIVRTQSSNGKDEL
ncbi:L-asparaginase [Blattamonas nauphoetae]|uniref:asparaginase n=1 Tax=Blattamonas nauphoetae TaxID=2049346 RepID=A0ABQ9Y4R7_9EUKA|nr:L-asparaginase [Blattamonas nauphoetae]